MDMPAPHGMSHSIPVHDGMAQNIPVHALGYIGQLGKGKTKGSRLYTHLAEVSLRAAN